MLQSLRRKISSHNAGFTACSCCTVGAVVIGLVFFFAVVPEFQMINSFQQDSCMMYDCGGDKVFVSTCGHYHRPFYDFCLCFCSESDLLVCSSHPAPPAGSCLDRRGAGLCSWNTAANVDHCTLYYNVSVLRVSFPVHFLHNRLSFYVSHFINPSINRFFFFFCNRVFCSLELHPLSWCSSLL